MMFLISDSEFPKSSIEPNAAIEPELTAATINVNTSLGDELRTSLASIQGALRLLSRNSTQLTTESNPYTQSDTQRLLNIAMANTHRLLGLTVAIEGTSHQANVLTIADIDRLRLEAELHQAIEQQDFVLVYQPIICVKTEQTIGLEALIRWQHPTRGLMLPKDFIPLAEANGLIVPLGQWVIRTACTQLRSWQMAGIVHPDLWVSVNLSPHQLLEPTLQEQCQAILDETQLPAACLHLEMTESAALDSGIDVLAVLQGLRQMGIKIYVDDFGTGYSSLARLHEFPIDALKIDRSFIVREQWEIIRMIGLLASHLNIMIVAEGVESRQHVSILKELGCHMIQGYLISRPLEAVATADFIGLAA